MKYSQRLNSIHSHPAFNRALEIIEKLKDHGHEAYFAGGCVRDALLGKLAKDIDIATSAVPNEVEKIFKNTVPVGKEFGVILVVVGEMSFELASFRFDGPYLDGRRPSKVTFTNAEEDAKRRDFTVNALFYNPVHLEVLDYVNGLQDLKRKVIRTVGVPTDRFREDKLRMLRAIRFVAQTGFSLESSTLTAIQAGAPEILSVSAERIFQEMTKLLSSPYWIRGLELLKFSGLAKYIWAEWSFASNASFLKGLGLPISWEHGFATVMWLTKSKGLAEARLAHWKAPKNSTRKILAILSSLHTLLETDVSSADRMRILGSAEFAEILSIARLHLIRANKNVNGVEQWINEYLERTGPSAELPSPLVSGDDLIKAGFFSDKKLGQILKLLYDEQLEGLINSKPEALERAHLLRLA